MDKRKIIDALNEALKTEMGGYIQNVTQAAVLQGLESLTLNPLFEKMAEENLKHAAILRERIFFLGGAPSMEIGPREVARETAEAVAINLRQSKEVIERYRSLFQMMAKEEEGSKLFEVLEDILEAEYDDYETFQRLAAQV